MTDARSVRLHEPLHRAAPAHVADADRHPDRSSLIGRAASTETAEPTDAEIGVGLAEGDERSLELAYQRWGKLVHCMASRRIGDPLEAEDVTQQVFLAAWRGRSGYRPDRGSVGAWLVGIARYKIADALSDRTRRLEFVSAAAAGLRPLAASGGDPDRLLDRVLLFGELERLPRVQREVLALAYFGDLTQVQIARRTGLPLGTVKAHCRSGLQRMRLRLRSEGSAAGAYGRQAVRSTGREALGSGPAVFGTVRVRQEPAPDRHRAGYRAKAVRSPRNTRGEA
ncbi:sigma-70 family RNA polymerase sigma factor [Streptomyces sp. NPDC059828]|uniref:sigma-70 family RNA polymerase sigma factor n=1 Tax=Streptomyces sp. NPDC059828 TaxID=3346965 RepID=UPI00364D70B8